ncbi:isoquinoline 1-oxidoreductase, beta subunit [Cyclobacterium xiamenense]|uniref:Isoquinoline 1-oxidoreductase, beta subunit n=1 Tax=Cyclobacterium xiamenense TaxID=1297121 RepID=A0A1H6W5V8_9BACT|nr:molybdopterin cofactor-binding domain-containing protein [Cyclobacterium xiamenense]SEJ07892.1 isoquinoline 1-oxidoreductase, beta subunit [Cyclobacterium xiamenense]
MLPKLPFFSKKEPIDKSRVYLPDRREFLKISSLIGGGFLLGVNFQCAGPKGETRTFAPNAYLRIASDNTVTIIAHRSEMGTGIRTTLPMVLADELGADWKAVRIEQAVGDEATYGDQNTDGSYSIRMFFEPMRRAGATARHMLRQAAAEQWDLDVSGCDTRDGMVIHESSGQQIPFGDLVERLQQLSIPEEESLTLRSLSDYTLVGKDVPIYDIQEITQGKARFGADLDLPGQQIAVILRSPVVGATIRSYNEEKALQVPGVTQVIKIAGNGLHPGLNKPLEGLAVLADHTWAAMKGREALEVDWDLGDNRDYQCATQMEAMIASTQQEGRLRREKGSIKTAFAGGGKTFENTYRAPYYAHATIEPPAALADYKDDGSIVIWAPTQHPQWARDSVAEALDMDVSRVTVHVTLLGGGFGRKSKPDFVVEAALLSKAIQKPVRVQWTREDDLHHDFYHSHSAQRIKAQLDGSGKLVAWNHHTVFPAIGGTSNAEELHPSDGEMGLGCTDFPYDVPNIRIESHEARAHTRVGWLRSVSNIHHAFAICTMLDEIAEDRRMDPVDYVLSLLGEDRKLSFAEEMKGSYPNYGEAIEEYPWDTARMKAVIRRVAAEAGWEEAINQGKTLGFAAHKSFLTYVACVVEVAEDASGNLIIPEVHYAVDCGIPVNTDRIRSQFEGGAQFATSLALSSAIRFENGQVIQNNFDGYQIIRMPEAPKKIYTHIIESTEKPTGVGEPPVPPFIPALCNALYKLKGKRIYELPIKEGFA